MPGMPAPAMNELHRHLALVLKDQGFSENHFEVLKAASETLQTYALYRFNQPIPVEYDEDLVDFARLYLRASLSEYKPDHGNDFTNCESSGKEPLVCALIRRDVGRARSKATELDADALLAYVNDDASDDLLEFLAQSSCLLPLVFGGTAGTSEPSPELGTIHVSLYAPKHASPLSDACLKLHPCPSLRSSLYDFSAISSDGTQESWSSTILKAAEAAVATYRAGVAGQGRLTGPHVVRWHLRLDQRASGDRNCAGERPVIEGPSHYGAYSMAFLQALVRADITRPCVQS